MFIGHFAVGLFSKKDNTLPSLAMMFIAVQMLDLIWPVFVLLGIETLSIDPGNTALTPLSFDYYPYSHSLLMALVWSVVLGVIYLLYTKNKQGSIILGVLVMSHWVLDFITHRPDLPISPFGDAKVGLGLWNHPVAAVVLELSLFSLGVLLYLKSSVYKRKTAFWLLIVFLLTIHIMNLFSPPPPNTMAVAWSANLVWIIVLWAWWIEKSPSKNSKYQTKEKI
ncbi:metal-dependent hydrolase [Lentiprolixibacter aurantiacus]|uniref:Permease n=1 Tax=Lentiprolixibacter aurantiacus TaxID=2993939 RepID=A0AAE3SLW0_9FLAO|nr:metal-dependent hydrolase [Lentiprolixibacter aurantiacus]MCX2718107.1 hypothetical protein [Lentiprolixibacter aurantiacus]